MTNRQQALAALRDQCRAIESAQDQAELFDRLTALSQLAGDLAAGFAERRAASPPKVEDDGRERFNRILNSMASFLGLVALDGSVLHVNEPGLRAAGIPLEQLRGTPIADLPVWDRPDITRPMLIDAVARAARGETVREDLRARASNGEALVLDATFSPLRDHQGRIVEIVVSAVDATERERARQESKASEQRLRQLAETIREAFWLREPSGKLVYVSPAYETIWGRSCQSLYQSPQQWFEAIHPDDKERVANATSKDIAVADLDCEYRVVRPDGMVVWIRDRAFPVRDPEGRILGIAGVADDITERRRLEEQMRQAQKMESVGRLAGGIAHDFNNLVTVILGNADLIASLVPPDHEATPLVGEILQTGRRAAALTRQLLAFSRQQVLDPKVVDLGAIIGDTEPMLGRLLGEDVDLQTSLRAQGLVRVDPGHLVQVIMNLAVNARDAMPKGGRLTIATSDVLLDCVPGAGHLARGSYVMLTMSDTGSGMTSDIRSRLFEPFFTTKDPGKGTGLGLAVVYGIVQQSGGHIDVDSEPGVGTRFHIYLPTVTGEADGVRPTLEAAGGGAAYETILLVEDDEDVRRTTARTLRRAGYQVIEAADGRDAIEVLDRASADIQLVLTDVIMPILGGRQIAEHVAAHFPRIKIVFTSGYTDDAVVRQGIFRSDVAFLQKPYPSEALLTKLRQVLHKPV